MNDDDDEIIDLDTIGEELKDQHSFLFEQNAEMVLAHRKKAHKMLEMAEMYETMGANCRQIAAAYILMASQMSEGVADLLAGEFAIEIVPGTDDEEIEDEDDE